MRKLFEGMSVWRLRVLAIAGLLLGTTLVVRGAFVDEFKSGIKWLEPKVIDPGPIGGPPSDAIVLFDGKDLSQWNGGEKWEIKDGVAIPREAGITSKQEFGDCQLHVEWATPSEVSGEG
ncbi:MAG TPA: family 16 glycoside hydrolase, partial [Planctomycetaceae bacterium]